MAPRVQEYLPEVEGAGPQGGLSPNTELIGREGSGLESFGTGLESAAELVERRQEQAENSQGFAATTVYNAQLQNQIKEQARNGTLDSDQISQQVDQWASDQEQNFTTPGSQNYFNRQVGRLKAMAIRQSGAAQAQLQGQQAAADFDTAMNANSNILSNDPTQFEDVYNKSMDYLHTQISNGAIPLKSQAAFEEHIGSTLTKSAIQGLSNQDYNNAIGQAQQIIQAAGSDPKALPKAEALKEAVTNYSSAAKALDTGQFDNYITADEKRQLLNQARQSQSAAVTEIDRMITLQKSAQAEQGEVWSQGALPKLVNNTLSTQAILQSPLTAAQKYTWLNMAKEAAKGTSLSDPSLKNNLVQRMLLPDNAPQKISDPSQLQQYVGKGLSPQDYSQLTTWFDKTPQGQVLAQNRKMLLQRAQSSLVQSNVFMGKNDPDGQYQLAKFTNALYQAESDLRNQKQSVAPLYDPNSPQYFGKQIDTYKLNAAQIQQIQADRMRQQLAPPVSIQTQPGFMPNQVPRGTPAPGAAGTPPPQVVYSKSGKPMVQKNGKWVYQ